MVIGQLDKSVIFYRNIGVVKGAGGGDQYELVCATRGYLKRNGGNRVSDWAEIKLDESWTLVVRKQALLRDIASAWKVTINEKRYTVQSVEEIDERNTYYRISLTAQRA